MYVIIKIYGKVLRRGGKKDDFEVEKKEIK